MDVSAKKPPSPPQTCAVCGESSHQVAIHYARLLCNGCRAFFKRTVQGKMRVTECKLRGECKVNPASRKDCKPCRYQACLKAGVDINKVQPARDTSTESTTSRDRKTVEDGESSNRMKSRLETAPPLFPEPFQYPNHHSFNPHQHHTYPHLPAMTTAAQASVIVPTHPAPNLYQVHFFNTLHPSQHHHHPYHHRSPFVPPNATSNNGCGSDSGAVAYPSSNTSSTATNSLDFNRFNIHNNNNNSSSSNSISNSSNFNSNDNNNFYHHSPFSAPSSNHVLPFVGVCRPQNTPQPMSSQTSFQEGDLRTFPRFMYTENPETNPLSTRPISHEIMAKLLNSRKPESSISQINQINKEASETSLRHSTADLRNQPFLPFDLTQRSKVQNVSSQSASSSSFPKGEIFHTTVDNKNSIPIPSFTQKSSAFMIDTLLEPHKNTNDTTTISRTTHEPKITHQNAMTPHSTEHTTTTDLTHELRIENDSGNVTATESRSLTDVHTTTPRSPISGENENVGSCSINAHVHNSDRETRHPETKTSEISRVMSPIANDDNEDDDDIFSHQSVQSSKNGEQSEFANKVLNKHKDFIISRDRLTSTPNQKQYSSRDSPEVELNVVDVINTPSPINIDCDNSSDSECSSDENRDEGGFEPRQQTTNDNLLQNRPKSESIKADNKLSSLSEIINSELNSAGKTENVYQHTSTSDTINLVEVEEKSAAGSVSQNGCSRLESDDSGIGCRSHSYSKSLSMSTTSSSTSMPQQNLTTFSSTKSFTTEENASLDELSSHDPDRKQIDMSRSKTGSFDTQSSCFHSNQKSQISESNDNDSSSILSNGHQNSSCSSGFESRGRCSDEPLKRSTPRKWKRLPSNENKPLAHDLTNSPKRVKCVSPSNTSPSRLGVSETVSLRGTDEKEINDEEKRLQSVLCRERLGEIKNFENSSSNEIHKKENCVASVPKMHTSDSKTDEGVSVSFENNGRANENEEVGDNCVNTDASQDKKSSVPLEGGAISSFLDSIIRRIRHADSDVEVRKAKKELENFYSSSDFR